MSLPSLEDIAAIIEGHLERIAAHQREIAAIEAKISSEREAIARQKQLWNAHSPANRCPPEVLARIFLLCRPSSWVNNPLLRFLHVSHVCACWRVSALCHPMLWNLVPCENAAMTDFMLARAKSVNLVYRGFGYADTKENKQSEAKLIQDISRVQVLVLEVVPEYLRAALHAALEKPAPVLETLHLTDDLGYGSSAPPLLFSGQVPKLREIRVRSWQFPWQASYLSQLHSLTLVHITNKISVSAMTVTLCNMKQLSRLDLDKVIEPDAEYDRTTERVYIMMPRLSFLRVDDEEPGVLILLQSLEAPMLRDLQISTLLRDGTFAGQIPASHLVSSYLNASSASFTSCDVVQIGNSLALSAGRTRPMQPFYPYANVEDSGFELSFHIRPAWLSGGRDDEAKADDAWLGAVAATSMLPVVQSMSDLSSLTVRVRSCDDYSVQQVMDQEFWPELLQDLPPSVTDIHIVVLAHIWHSLAFTSTALRNLASLHMPSGTSHPSLPATGLRYLTLVDANVDTSDQLHESSNGLSLRAFLEARAAHDLRIERLELVNCKEDGQLADLEAEGLVAEMVRR
jgi:hypothetical protein